MGFLHMPRASRKMQRTLKNLRVSLLCFLLTFLVLRNTIGAGKFGTPAQDFEEIRQHLHYVGLHRSHSRVLAEAVEEEQQQREAPMLTLERRSLSPEAGIMRTNEPLRVFEKKQGNALIVKQGNAPLLTSRTPQGGLLKENVGFQKDLESSRIESWDMQRKAKAALAHGSYGTSRVLLIAGLQSSGCENPAGEHFLHKSLKNKVDYTTLHGLEISLSFGGVDPEMRKPLSKLSLLQRTMVKYPHVEWLWWMPKEAVFTDMAFALPMENYTEFNLVLLASDANQKGLINLNTDTFLIRNCQWSLDILSACGHGGIDQASKLLTNYMIKGPHLGPSDQCALISDSNQKKGEFANKIHVQHSAVLSGNWHDVVEKVERIGRQTQGGVGAEKLPFVTHFLGCNACQKVGNEVCVNRMERAIAYAEKQSMQSYVLQHKSLASS